MKCAFCYKKRVQLETNMLYKMSDSKRQISCFLWLVVNYAECHKIIYIEINSYLVIWLSVTLLYTSAEYDPYLHFIYRTLPLRKYWAYNCKLKYYHNFFKKERGGKEQGRRKGIVLLELFLWNSWNLFSRY